MNEGSITTANSSSLNTGRVDGARSRSPNSRSGNRRHDVNLQKKLEDITKQLSEVREKRLKLKKFDDGRVYGPRTDYSKVPRKLFSHPKLEYVYGEIMSSPYLVNPIDKYPKASLELNETVKALKHKNIPFKDLPPELKPYDETEVKKQFIREVCNYNPKFNIPKAIMERKLLESSMVSSKGGTINSAVSTSSKSLSKSMKESGSLRHRQLNKVNGRKHPSATSMSLDASGFMPSNRSGTASTTATTGTVGSSAKSSSAWASAADAVFVTGADVGAGPGGEPESTTQREEATADGGDYEDDFDGPSSPTKGFGEERNGSSAKEGADDAADDIYDADFENTAVSVEAPVRPPEPTAEEAESYQDDFEQAPALAAVSESAPSPSPAAVPVPAPAPAAPTPEVAPAPGPAVSSDSRPESLKIRTDLIAPQQSRASLPSDSPTLSSSNSTATQQPPPLSAAEAHAVLTKQGTSSSEIREELTGRDRSVGRTTPVPSTVRSEEDAPIAAPTDTHAAPEQAVRTGVAELSSGDDADAPTTASGEVALPPSVQTAVSIGEEEASLVDEPIDEIAYVESGHAGADGQLDGDVQSNNYVHSPQPTRGARSDSIADETEAEAAGTVGTDEAEGAGQRSPVRLGDQPDEEIREEIE